ncbi:hypothetical protein NDU88_003611 [Pleurodeles waltl]|uniref:Uncharacterized protein n=1 Tax=Pleurodeles waltl TaxID=8319 RepID=A0AAV7W5T5_PLEWA|nr:hypothetical protein NDU88_003611 [Pleurodeles waltl]
MRSGAGGPADGLVRARKVPGGRTRRPVAVPEGVWPGCGDTIGGPLGDLIESRPRGALGFCSAATEEALLDPTVHLRSGSSAGRLERLGRPPGCLLETRGSAQSRVVSAVVVAARGGRKRGDYPAWRCGLREPARTGWCPGALLFAGLCCWFRVL